MATQNLTFGRTSFEISIADFKNFALNQVHDMVHSYFTSLQIKDKNDGKDILVQAEATRLITSIDLEKQKKDIKKSLDDHTEQYGPQVATFRAKLEKLIDNLVADCVMITNFDLFDLSSERRYIS